MFSKKISGPQGIKDQGTTLNVMRTKNVPTKFQNSLEELLQPFAIALIIN